MRTVSQLLSVAIALAAAPAAAASGDPLGGGGDLHRWETDPELAQAIAEVRMYEFSERDAMTRFLVTPRRLANGAPACGNVGGKPMPVPCTPAYADELAAIRHAEMLASVARAHAARARLANHRARDSSLTVLLGPRPPS